MDLSVDEIAQIVGGTVVGDGSIRIRALNGLRNAGAGDLTFYSDPRYGPQFTASKASAILVSREIADGPVTLIQVGDPYFAFAQMLQRFEAETLIHPTGIHPSASIDPSANVGKDVGIGPHVTVESGATVGSGCVLYAGVYVGRNAQVGECSVLYPNAVVRERCMIGAHCIIHPNATIGGDGFGFAAIGGQRVKIPQVGNVVLGDEVEVGANSSIDRATAGSTRIGRGTKIDSQVQIGHNAQIGEHCAISGCSGISGSAVIGNNVTIGGFTGVGGHIEVGDNVIVGGRSGVNASVAAGSVVSDFPATDHNTVRRYLVSKFRVPEALKRIRQLEKRVDELERK